MVKLVVVDLMAGLSERFGGPKNKQLCLLNGKPVFEHSIDTFSKSKLVNELIIVVNKNNKDDVEKYIKQSKIDAKIVMGGATRQESVENAIKSIQLSDEDVVIIHDAARPLVSEQDIYNVFEAAKEHGASTTYLPAVDTIAVMNEKEEVSEFVKRSTVAQIQTPQGFKFGLLKEAHKLSLNNKATDDCSLVLALGNKVKLVLGSKKLHKITTEEDLRFLEGIK